MSYQQARLSIFKAGLVAILLHGIQGGGVLGAVSFLTEGQTDLVATGTGVAITSRDLDQLSAHRLAKLRAQEYELKRQALEDHLAQMLLRKEAAALHISPEELEKREVQDRIHSVSEAEVQAYLEKSKTPFGKVGEPDPDELKRIREGLQWRRLQERRQEYYRELRSKANIQIRLEPPRVAVRVDDAPVKGLSTAAVTIVEFSDFQCPYCSRAAQVLKQIQERYQDQVRIVFRHFPLPMHEQAPKAAEAASCAQEQGHFWPMHDRIFENQKSLQPTDLKRLASEIGLNREAFDHCQDSGKYADQWKRDVEEGESYGVSGTPTLFINGRLITKAPTYGYLVSVMEEELAGRKQSSLPNRRQDTLLQKPERR
jgi:protein-disulfide isomerase